ncbi:acyl-CoA dehydrogenase, partial [Arthrobacter deserti]|nr:acyl-CoA dehydrogenase [Arthrobacter deserti]
GSEFQDRLFGQSPDLLSCGTNQPHPGASLEQQPDGSYLLNGRWSFASGVMNARYTEVSLPLGRNEQNAEMRITAMVPRHQVEIVDVWHTSGMRGTGSQDIAFNDVTVPAEMVHKYE